MGWASYLHTDDSFLINSNTISHLDVPEASCTSFHETKGHSPQAGLIDFDKFPSNSTKT
jgi:hypothetical protein